jgi:hypothetical protein
MTRHGKFAKMRYLILSELRKNGLAQDIGEALQVALIAVTYFGLLWSLINAD